MRLRTVIMDVTWSVFVVYLYFRLPIPTLWKGTLSDADIRGAIKKFCNSVLMHKRHRQNNYIIFQYYLPSHQHNCDIGQKGPSFQSNRFLMHAVETRLSGLLDLIIAANPLSTKMLLQMSKQVEVAGCQVC